ncbi:MAG: hypothetical protein QM730_17085 [Anaerolineales bacterium]
MDDERRSMPQLTADANFTTMRLDNLLHDCKPETRAMTFSPRAGRIHLIETVK